MKPHEETWVAEAGNVYVAEASSAKIAFPDKARARLAVQAPEMARLLLRLRAWAAEESSYSALPLGLPVDCDPEQVLRDAGVLP